LVVIDNPIGQYCVEILEPPWKYRAQN
jgi:hypothetical protein